MEVARWRCVGGAGIWEWSLALGICSFLRGWGDGGVLGWVRWACLGGTKRVIIHYPSVPAGRGTEISRCIAAAFAFCRRFATFSLSFGSW